MIDMAHDDESTTDAATPRYEVRSFVRSDGLRSSALLGPKGVVQPVNDLIRHSFLTRPVSHHTLRAWCLDLKLWFTFLDARGAAWDTSTWQEDQLLARFVHWLRTGSLTAPHEQVVQAPLPTIRSEKTIERTLSSVYTFYDHHATTRFGRSVREYRSASLNRQAGSRQRLGALRPVRVAKKDVKIVSHLTRDQLAAVKEACDTHRDRLIVCMMGERGLRAGALLGLRHSDLNSRAKTYSIIPRRDNVNGALAKTDRTWVLPMRDDHLSLHKLYMYEEYGDIDCDYLFINLHGPTRGQPMTYHGISALMERLSGRVGFPIHAHLLRHTFATLAIEDGIPMETVQSMLTHKDISTTSRTYIHLGAEALRRMLGEADNIGGNHA